MMKQYSILLFLILIPAVVFAQNERKVIRQGVKAYHEGNYSDAEVQFRKAGDINQESFEAEFNTGAALYGQEKYEETVKQYESLVENSSDPELAQVWHNMGNSMLEAQQYEPSIEAYKKSLRLNPTDQDTKYNLAYAMKKLQEQQQQQQENKDQKNQDKEQQDQKQKDQEQQDQEQKDQEQKDQEQKDQKQQDQEQKEQEQQEQEQQQRPQEISKEDAERMLNAIQQQEKDVKEKVDKKKAAAVKVKTEKDW